MKNQLNQRQEQILLSLKKLDYLNRQQLQRLHRLGKTRNANRVLQDLAPYLSSYREGYQSVYYLNSLGREYVNSEKVRKKTQFVNHVLMRNEFYLHMKCPVDWKNEMRVKDGKVTLIVDGWFKSGGKYHFLEVDSTQKMSENRAKINAYRELQQRGVIAQDLGYFPVLVWLTASDYRKKQLKKLLEGIPARVFTLSEIH